MERFADLRINGKMIVQKEERKRNNNYDLLRIISTLAVIGIHVTANWLYNYSEHLVKINIMDTMFRFAVLCFVMLAGAFALSDEKNQDAGRYYKKIFQKLYKPTIMVSIIYIAVNTVEKIIGGAALVAAVKEELFFTVIGVPEWHLWYMFMMVTIYLAVPFIIKLKKQIGKVSYITAVGILCCLSVISDGTSSHRFLWDIGYSVCYLGFFMLGDILREKTSKEKSSLGKGLICIALAMGMLIILGAIRGKAGVQPMETMGFLYASTHLAPIPVLSAILIFLGFSYMEVKKDYSKIAGATFGIYLIHYAVQEVLYTYVPYIHWIQIPLNIVITFMISYILVRGFEQIKRKCSLKRGREWNR